MSPQIGFIRLLGDMYFGMGLSCDRPFTRLTSQRWGFRGNRSSTLFCCRVLRVSLGLTTKKCIIGVALRGAQGQWRSYKAARMVPPGYRRK